MSVLRDCRTEKYAQGSGQRIVWVKEIEKATGKSDEDWRDLFREKIDDGDYELVKRHSMFGKPGELF